ncbi:hypothetical protein COO60DRAFT_1272152, partial [Scenedesmus sp. NREL 46B-D3]
LQNLQQVPAASYLGQLSDLRSLTISKCRSLEVLPASIGCLSRLTSLTLSGCNELLEVPHAIGGLTALHKLIVSRCMMLRALHASLAGLWALKELILINNYHLGDLDEGVLAGMESLHSLSISMCSGMRCAAWLAAAGKQPTGSRADAQPQVTLTRHPTVL